MTRTLNVNFSQPKPTYFDYNNNGVDDFMAGGCLLDGQTGAILRTWTVAQDIYGLPAYAPIPDVTGDGKPEFLFGSYQYYEGAVWAVPSESTGGAIGSNVPLIYQIPAPESTGGFGQYLAVTSGPGPTALIGWSSAGKALLIDPATGAVQARFSRSTSSYSSGLSLAMGAVGDINGDGIQDFAIGDPNVNNGELYLVNGHTTTAGTSYVPINTSSGLLATLHTNTPMTLGAFGQNCIANLGDEVVPLIVEGWEAATGHDITRPFAG